MLKWLRSIDWISIGVSALVLTAVLIVIPSPSPQNEAAGYSQQQPGEITAPSPPDERIANYTLGLELFTALLTVVSMFQGWMLLRGDNTARIAANASAKASEAAVAVEMPMVFLSKLELLVDPPKGVLSPSTLSDPFGGDVPPERAQITATFKNYGRTPARAENFSIRHLVVDNLPPEPEHSLVSLSSGTVISPNGDTETYPHFSRIIYFRDEWRRAIEKRKASIWIFGMLQYRDFLGGPHTHRFCARWHAFTDPQTGKTFCGFVDEGPDAYRKDD